MKLLFDQNSSHRIIKKLPKAFKDCNQVRNLSLVNASDIEIWNFAKTNNFHVVTFDADFFNIAQLNGHPPKIIWIRSGNLTTNKIVELLTKHKNTISEFVLDNEYKNLSCLEIT